MKRFLTTILALIFWAAFSVNNIAQIIGNDSDTKIETSSGDFLGIKFRPEIRAIIAEIERKTGNEIYAEFVGQEGFILGSSFISEDGVPVVLIDYRLENGDAKKLEAVIVHELLHLRLTANGYPAFLFSESVNMSKGRAIDTEQSNINDVRSLIEHQIFKADMQKFGLYKYIDLAGDTAKVARKNKNRESEQADSINYARAILEYPNAKDIEEVKKIYTENKWTRPLREGEAIAGIIGASNIKTPKEAEAVFLKCLNVLYPLPSSAYTFKLTLDPKIKIYRQMIVSISRQKVPPKRGSKRN